MARHLAHWRGARAADARPRALRLGTAKDGGKCERAGCALRVLHHGTRVGRWLDVGRDRHRYLALDLGEWHLGALPPSTGRAASPSTHELLGYVSSDARGARPLPGSQSRTNGLPVDPPAATPCRMGRDPTALDAAHRTHHSHRASRVFVRRWCAAYHREERRCRTSYIISAALW